VLFIQIKIDSKINSSKYLYNYVKKTKLKVFPKSQNLQLDNEQILVDKRLFKIIIGLRKYILLR
jgi:hypothetical protein